MTPEERATAVCRDSRWTIEPWKYDLIVAAIRAAERAAIERCATACDTITTDKHAQYKGRAPHAPNNDHRADTYTEGQSDGAAECAAAIRAMD